MRRAPLAGFAALVGFASIATEAAACGQSTHIWTALHAIEHVPDGPLAEVMRDPAVRGALVSGTMFPDGGYSPLVAHPYGEASHWEPFQDHVVDYVGSLGSLDDPQSKQWLGFLLGLAAHGIGDQVFDAAYLYRSDRLDPMGSSGADTSTDIVIASQWGAHAVNEHFVPYEALIPMFAAEGVDVDVPTMATGMSSLDLAVAYVGAAASDPATVADHSARFPWANAHLDSEMPGSPACLGETIAGYWAAVYARVQRQPHDDAALIVRSWPADGSYAWATAADDPLSTMHVVFGRAMRQATVEASGRVTLTGPEGEVPVAHWMYYREASNVLNVRLLEDLAADASYTLTVHPGVETIGGDVTAAALTVRFSTGAEPAEDPVVVEDEGGCSCGFGAGAAGPWWIGALVGLTRRRRVNTSVALVARRADLPA